MVTPQPRRSLTLKTLDITSRPRLSNTRTFHIGSPSEFNIGVLFGRRPLDAAGSCGLGDCSSAEWLRFKILSMEAKSPLLVYRALLGITCSRAAYLLAGHGGLDGG